MRKRGERRPTGFGKRLKELREQADVSQEKLAAKAGVSANTVAKIEQGHVEPMWRTVIDLADALEVSTEEFRG